ncbi:DUF805 domain-containing protein [Rhodobacteraceae bacterium N5(2021)]|uniref:DUF805 domain-containing protein n=1 Tax=Gymnodinialimonas phycosphaerae TaxID=2841589 RepID=A0A975YFN1_9RHOB|nr:DUF805 domain-containing protein [Gymnodinialimonas phycosphaerae]MBY4894894.1 DUF805 domain-containing protein [Gymnodinialimonas phycosphaerae]
MTFSEAIRTNIVECLNFQGRAPRSAYWWYILFISLGSIVTFILDFMIFWPPLEEMGPFLIEGFGSISDFYINIMPITTFWYLLNYLPMLAVGVRRMHDCDRPGWWFIATVVFVTIMSIVVFQVVGPQSAEMMMIAFDPNPSMSEINAMMARMEDLNRTSSILSGIQTLPSLLVIIWMASKGTNGPNQYGEDPLA